MSTTTNGLSGAELALLKTRGRRRPLRWVATAVVLLVAALVVYSMLTNERFGWPVVAQYLFDSRVLNGLVLSIWLTVVCMVIALVLGTLLAVMRLSANSLLRSTSWIYIWIFRSVPVLVQLIFWYNLGALYPSLGIGIPFLPPFMEFQTNDVISALGASILGLSLAQSAYSAEIIRAGILSVSRGQLDAAASLGMTRARALRRIVLPQALRVIIPPVGNEVVGMLKNTSLVSVIAMADLFYSVELIYANTFQTIPMLIVACIWYLVVVSLLSFGQSYLERRYGRGFA
ncbi:amino acid ABC transporter permease [Compostimonas suwonensis]|nr:amino acid ABC transporter permease [Compostimonas suwonensis]